MPDYLSAVKVCIDASLFVDNCFILLLAFHAWNNVISNNMKAGMTGSQLTTLLIYQTFAIVIDLGPIAYTTYTDLFIPIEC